MNKTDADRLMVEVEKLWRSRTPATNIYDVCPEDRVTKYDVLAIAESLKISFKIAEYTDDEFCRAMFNMIDRLRKEFPNEKWEPKKNMTAATRRKRKELGL